MKRDRQSVNLRRGEMLSLIRERQERTVEELAGIFGVSLMTVRRDLQVLEASGQVSRFHGGATAALRRSTEKSEVNLYCQLIARYAASLVENGDHLFINGSSTALSMLSYLGDKAVHVFTNNGAAIGRQYPAGVEITISGGSLRGDYHIMTGDCTIRNLLITKASKAFLGCSGISPDGEILCGIPTELGINETMIAHSQSYFILADHTKIGKTGTYASFSLEKTGCVITDEKAPSDVVERLRAIGMSVVQVRKDDFADLDDE